ncbi:hypothetical protein DES53_113146 [Roseimicrobium gellanilyticum]|uniref:4-amino-4-deoxy-L-arabinose transferase-like glycosyltransferase n=1 Tax=Roseimicrobium gellanilyticum TaxID=748857 RepID=A0A366H6X9_9BACT|nr:hypothetical protein [Roseimicrobium gellanilyticum]RBP37763.1 hypothetical protein DES53_113146 [Roseimicrobium gellanilyticum]
MTSPNRKPLLSRLLFVLGWTLAWSPALLILTMLLPLRVPVPFEDAWAFVKQYRDWWEGDYGWREFLAPHNNHPSASGKVFYFIALHWLGGDVGVLPLVAWAFSLIIAVSVWVMARSLWMGRSSRGMLLMFCANLTIFTAAQGHSWVWDFVFQNFIPGMAFCAALATLWKWPGSWSALVVAWCLSIMATFSFGTGFLAGLLLTPMVAMHFREKPLAWRGAVTAIWLLLTGGAAFLALSAFGEATYTGDESRVGSLLEQPVLLAQFVLVLLGYLLGNGTTMEPALLCALAGLGLVVILLACVFRVWQLRKEPGMVQAAMPWVLTTLFGLLNAGLISYGRLRSSMISAMAPRYVTFTLFFTLGVLLLAAVVAVRDKPSGWFRVGMRRAGLLLVGGLIALHVVNWNHGWQHMKWEHERMQQDRALLSFAKVLPLDPEVMWQNLDHKDLTTRLALFLHEHDRLKSVRLVKGVAITDFRRGSPLPDKWAWLEAPVVHEGVMHLSGACGVSKDMVSLPELVLITAQSADAGESVVSFATPRQPFDFYENEWLRRQHPGHYFGWARELPVSRFPKGKVTVRAYGYWMKGFTVRALDREHVIDL